MQTNNVDEEEQGTTVGTVLQRLFQDCVGIILIQMVEVDLLCSANVGLGILVAKTNKTKHSTGTKQSGYCYSDHWSLPTACGLTRMGWGQGGGSIGGGSGGATGSSIQDILLFLMDASRLDEAITCSRGLHLGGTGNGGGAEGDGVVPHCRTCIVEEFYPGSSFVMKSVVILGLTVKGDFVGLSLDGGGYLVEPRRAVNKWFYGCSSITPKQILFPAEEDNAPELHIPLDCANLVKDVYDKLDKLAFRRSPNNRQVPSLENSTDRLTLLERGPTVSDHQGASNQRDGENEPLTSSLPEDAEQRGRNERLLVVSLDDVELQGTRIIHPPDDDDVELPESTTLPNENQQDPETISLSLAAAAVHHDGPELLGAAIAHPEEEEVAEI